MLILHSLVVSCTLLTLLFAHPMDLNVEKDEIEKPDTNQAREVVSLKSSDNILIRKKRFLWSISSLLNWLQNLLESWRQQGRIRFCGNNRYGTPIYTNGFVTLCSGQCGGYDVGDHHISEPEAERCSF